MKSNIVSESSLHKLHAYERASLNLCFIRISILRVLIFPRNNPIIFPRTPERNRPMDISFFMLIFICFRRPSPTCPADRQPLSREKVFLNTLMQVTHAVTQTRDRRIIPYHYIIYIACEHRRISLC